MGKLLKFLRDFLSERRQRIVVNGQTSTWTNATAGVHQRSIIGPLLNGSIIGPLLNGKLFADDTYLLSVIHDSQTSANVLKKDLEMTTGLFNGK